MSTTGPAACMNCSRLVGDGPHTCWGIAPPRPCTCRPESVVKAEALRVAADAIMVDAAYLAPVAREASQAAAWMLRDLADALERDHA